MNLLKFLFILSLIIAPFKKAQAEDFWPAMKNYFSKYGPPCLAGMGVGYVIDRDKGVQIGAIGCVVTFTYGEFGRGANRTITNDDVAIIDEMINKSNTRLQKSISDDLDARMNLLNQRITDESQNNRAQIRSTVTDLGVFLEKDLSEKMEEKLKNPSLMENVERKITEKVKEEVQTEYKTREREIVNKTTDMVIKRVVAEPVIVDGKSGK